jgi:protein O-GlcNAc transferase
VEREAQSCDALCRQGNRLLSSGNAPEAISFYKQALAIRPDYAEIHANLSYALLTAGRADEALAACRRAVALRPDLALAWNNLGHILLSHNQYAEAADAFRQAIRLRPNLLEAAYNLGNALCAIGKNEEAITLYRQVIAQRPDFAQAHSNLATVLADLGQIERAMDCFEEGLRAQPCHPGLASSQVFTAHFNPAFDRAALFEQYKRWNRLHGAFPDAAGPHDNDPSPDRRLRIGYVSPDFKRHAESFFTFPLLSRHDHANFEIICYADVSNPDSFTQHFQQCADRWQSIVGWSDERLAQTIRENKIDILVDLTMHMERNRLLAMARKPAPIQVTWLAYPGGTGLKTIDYRLTDPFIDPPGEQDRSFFEQSIRLPDCWCCYDPLSDLAVQTNRPPGPVRFGSLNHPRKINATTADLFCRVLSKVPDSSLIVLTGGPLHNQAIQLIAQKHGVAPHRIEFLATMPRDDYLKTYHRIDIALDAVPYNGMTTTCDALWMGVPVITLIGNTGPGRMGLSVLSALGMPELIAKTPQDFIRIAADMARDFPRLQTTRSSLRPRLTESPLMDSSRFARNVESAYRAMWRRWCDSAAVSSASARSA